jgi:hypothetical protein
MDPLRISMMPVQMARLKRAGLRTTATVDTVAASGGYMLACVADRLIAAPFAFLGSIGVVAQMINIHKVQYHMAPFTFLRPLGSSLRGPTFTRHNYPSTSANTGPCRSSQ